MAKKPFAYKLAVLGDGGVGKTALISRLRSEKFVEEFDPTIEDSYTIGVVVNDQEYGWIRANEGFILVYSVSSRPSFPRIQGLYNQIQHIKKSTHPDIPQIPSILVGNKFDIAQRKVSLTEGGNMARELGCAFLEVEPSQLQKPKATAGEEVLDYLLDSAPKWHALLNILEGELSRSATANTRLLIQVLPSEERAPLGHRQTPTTLHVPWFAKRQRSFPGLFQPLSYEPQSLASQNQKASSVGRGMLQSSEHSDHRMLDGNYDLRVQKAFQDTATFLTRLGRKMRDFQRRAKFEGLRARIEVGIDAGENCTDGGICLGSTYNRELTAAGKVDRIGKLQEIELALRKCQSLCEDASFKVLIRENAETIFWRRRQNSRG